MVGALLHDIGWQLAGVAHEQSGNPDSGVDTGVDKAPQQKSLAAKLGILELVSVPDGASSSQQRAQHDVIGAAWLRMNGFHETGIYTRRVQLGLTRRTPSFDTPSPRMLLSQWPM